MHNILRLRHSNNINHDTELRSDLSIAYTYFTDKLRPDSEWLLENLVDRSTEISTILADKDGEKYIGRQLISWFFLGGCTRSTGFVKKPGISVFSSSSWKDDEDPWRAMAGPQINAMEPTT